jgi:hypothetical protein
MILQVRVRTIDSWSFGVGASGTRHTYSQAWSSCSAQHLWMSMSMLLYAADAKGWGHELNCSPSPDSRVIGTLQQFGTGHLTFATLGTFHSDVPVIGDDREASDLVEALIDGVTHAQDHESGAELGISAVR